MAASNRAPPGSGSKTTVAGSRNYANDMTNGSAGRVPTAQMPTHAPATNGKKSKNKKVADPLEAQRLLEAKISQLESDATGEQNEEQDIKREVRKAAKDFNDGLSHMSMIDKVEALRKKNTELLADMKRLERDLMKSKKREDQLRKEKDSTRTEQNKMATAKDIAEKLARELRQERNKAQEELRKANDDAIRQRDKMDAKDSALLGDIEEFVEAKSRATVPAQESPEIETLFRQRFKSLFEQLACSELRFQHAIRSKDAELHLIQGRLDHQRRLHEAEVSRSRGLNAQVQTFSQTETELRSQLNIYVEKFKQVEDTLNNSNELFLTFRKEMEEMSKKTKRLEKENLTLTRKHDLNNRNILEMAEDRTKTTSDNERLRRTVSTLQSTIRQMQSQGRNLPAAGSALEVDGDPAGAPPPPATTAAAAAGGGGGGGGGVTTESEYGSEEDEEEEDYEPASDEVYEEDDDETEDDMPNVGGGSSGGNGSNSKAGAAAAGGKNNTGQRAGNPPTFGPVPPPPPASNAKMVNGHRDDSKLIHT